MENREEENGQMTHKQAILLLSAVTATRGAAFLFSKLALRTMDTFNLMGIRFLLGFIILFLIFGKRIVQNFKWKTLCFGAVLGVIYTAVMALELTSIKTTPTSTTAFLEHLAIIFVPIAESVIRKKLPKPASAVSALLAIAGVALLTLSGNGSFVFTKGEVYAVICAVTFAVAIILTDRMSHTEDGLIIGFWQLGFMGVFGFIISFFLEAPKLPGTVFEWAVVLILALVCTAFGFAFQPVAQSGLSSEESGTICALNPTVASILGAMFLKEPFSLQSVMGALLILSGLIITGKFGGDTDEGEAPYKNAQKKSAQKI